MQPRSILRHALLGLAAALLTSGCASLTASLADLPPIENSQYRLGAGDEVRVYIYGLEAFNNTTFTVAGDGTLSLPMVDKVQAGGRTFSQLESGIKQALLERRILNAPIVNVQPSALRPFYILGEVNKPGEYTFRPGMSVQAAVSMAGGYTFRADQSAVAITRKVGGNSLTGRARVSDPIEPGDQIEVYERWF
ncbi:polysaccharide biosynthesis/export family protein [Stakelama saccharophila]|uniref:Polysaccharide biosynthesis/export family protein n=1 Tax=Stakelama saccharophila TaxID=3075605 RepID=A0ABZ0B9X4_9SPHN|nr:polysaccharide biosynthesis/export family protein [Stakelama sp. W311]WNO54200.1 polysaccharide biosynthesis/export family protein [Stakelama sp. W311]